MNHTFWQGGIPGETFDDNQPCFVKWYVWEGGVEGSERRIFSLRVIYFNPNLAYSKFHKKGLGMKRSQKGRRGRHAEKNMC